MVFLTFYFSFLFGFLYALPRVQAGGCVGTSSGRTHQENAATRELLNHLTRSPEQVDQRHGRDNRHLVQQIGRQALLNNLSQSPQQVQQRFDYGSQHVVKQDGRMPDVAARPEDVLTWEATYHLTLPQKPVHQSTEDPYNEYGTSLYDVKDYKSGSTTPHKTVQQSTGDPYDWHEINLSDFEEDYDSGSTSSPPDFDARAVQIFKEKVERKRSKANNTHRRANERETGPHESPDSNYFMTENKWRGISLVPGRKGSPERHLKIKIPQRFAEQSPEGYTPEERAADFLRFQANLRSNVARQLARRAGQIINS